MNPDVPDEGYRGTGIWIRIQHRFGPRVMEWFYAMHLAIWGWVLTLPDDLFSQPGWSGFRDVVNAFGLSEYGLGLAAIFIGVLRICGLIINGARKDVTPRIRQFSAAVSCLIWVGISYGFASSDVLSTWLAIYPLFAIGDLVNFYRAAHDEGENRNGKAG